MPLGMNRETIAVIRVLLLHPTSGTATELAAALDDADPGVDVVASATAADAEQALQDRTFDGVVAAVDPADQAGVALLRAVRETAPDLPSVLAPDADADATETLVDRPVFA